MIEESKGADDGGGTWFKTKFWVQKEQKYLFRMLALERVVVDEIERLSTMKTKTASGPDNISSHMHVQKHCQIHITISSQTV